MKALRIAGVLVVIVALFAPAIVPAENKNAVEAVIARVSPFTPFIAAIGLIMVFVAIARRIRFTIRDMLWLAALVALAVGWWLDHREMKYNSIEEYRNRAAEKVKEMEAKANAQSIGQFEKWNAEAAERAAFERQEQAAASR